MPPNLTSAAARRQIRLSSKLDHDTLQTSHQVVWGIPRGNTPSPFPVSSRFHLFLELCHFLKCSAPPLLRLHRSRVSIFYFSRIIINTTTIWFDAISPWHSFNKSIVFFYVITAENQKTSRSTNTPAMPCDLICIAADDVCLVQLVSFHQVLADLCADRPLSFNVAVLCQTSNNYTINFTN